MNSIKSNPFVSSLIAVTVVVCGALLYLAARGGTRYDHAKAAFEDSYASVSASEGIQLYPTDANMHGKSKALTEYRQSISELNAHFDKFRPGLLENVKPQVFTDRLKNANEEVTKAFESVKCELPGKFFLGFEAYSGGLAKEEATGVLGYQLEGISHALLGLAEAHPSKLMRIHRVAVPEENGGTFQSAPNSVARDFAVEFTFKGSESAARKFISYLGETNSHFYVVRCVKIVNERDTPPKVSDAKFEDDKPPVAATADPFSFFAPIKTAPAQGDSAPALPAEKEPVLTDVVDTSRMLAQVLGNEEIIVFVRFDIAMFLPSKELPKP